MRSQWKRLALAAGLSLLCAGATLMWYYGTEKKIAGSNEAPLAQVSRVGDEVLRRPPTRLLWQEVNTGDNLYNGETLRTSNRGELRIQFEDGRYIDLEPDSLIVLQKSKGEISLDLMEGSLFVNAKTGEGTGGAAPGLVLNSKNGKVDLTGASASLSKGSGDRLDVQVLEGKATLQGADGKAKELSSGRSSSIGAAGGAFDNSNLTILSPVSGKPFFINPDEAKPVFFKWRGYPPGWKVRVLAGPTRKDLREIGVTEKPGDSEIFTTLPIGKHWWKLVAFDPATNQVMTDSPVTRLDLQARYAPTVVFPLADAEIPVERAPYNMTFKWEKLDEGRIQLEVSPSPEMKTLVFNRAVTKEDQLVVPNLAEGTYYWRVSANYPDLAKPVVGKVQKFTVMKLDESKKPPAEIVLTVPQDKVSQTYVHSPQLELTWEAKTRADDIAGYRLNLGNEQNPAAAPVRVEAREPHARADLPAPGRYIASVEALDKNGRVIGRSQPMVMAANELPLIGSPTLQPPSGPLQSGFDGRTELRWDSIEGAKEYQLTIHDKSGKELAKKKYSSAMASLKNLMPGEYTVTVEAFDAHGRASQSPVPRTLVVPESSGLKAPTMKKIKVN